MVPGKYLTQVKFQSKMPVQNAGPRKNIIYLSSSSKAPVHSSTLIAEQFRRGRFLPSHRQKLPSIFSYDFSIISQEIFFTLNDQNLLVIYRHDHA
jgi:hypothetical protein